MVDNITDINNSSYASDIIVCDQKWTLLVVACNLEKNDSKLKNKTKIEIDSKKCYIDKSSIGYENELIFGREAKINNNINKEGKIEFDESDQKISRTQFALKFDNNYLHIKCLVNAFSGKTPTLIRITQTEFYLEKENIITFGQKNSLTFRVLDYSVPNYPEKPWIKLQLVSLNPDEKKRLYADFRIEYNGKQIIGSDGLFDSSNLELYNIILGYNKIKNKWYLFEKEKSIFGNECETFVYLFKYDQIKWGKEPSTIQNWTKLEENIVIKVGEYYLKIKRN